MIVVVGVVVIIFHRQVIAPSFTENSDRTNREENQNWDILCHPRAAQKQLS